MQSLLSAATASWHVRGRPDQALLHLRWASRRAADRRRVRAAGGYDIQGELREQFRGQEHGTVVTPQALADTHAAWQSTPGKALPDVAPTLLQVEQLCRKQKPAKAPGPDGIRNGLWASQPAMAGRWTWQLHLKLALTGREPSDFKHAIACALYKKGPAALPANYRSIVLLNGVAKVWHSHLRSTIGRKVVNAYQPLQLGGRPGMHVGYALAAFRVAAGLTAQASRSHIALFVDVQAAFYEVDRELLFGESSGAARAEAVLPWVQDLLDRGALQVLGLDEAEIAMLRDCVRGSSWLLQGDRLPVLAARGSRPGDGLADVLFGAVMTCIIAKVNQELALVGIAHHSIAIACADEQAEPCAIAWLVLLADVDHAGDVPETVMRMGNVVFQIFRAFRLRVNTGPGKTEFLIDPRGAGADRVRGDMLQGTASIPILDEHVRIASEYKYLGVPQLPRDNGRHDIENAVSRGRAAEHAAGSLLTRSRLPWPVREGWVSGRILPAAYATLATSLAPGPRSLKPLEGLLDRIRRKIWQSWQEGHHAANCALEVLMPLQSPREALLVARCRLLIQLCCHAPSRVWDLFEAAYYRDAAWPQSLLASARVVWAAAGLSGDVASALRRQVQANAATLLRTCRRLSRFGTLLRACHDHWRQALPATPLEADRLPAPAPVSFPCRVCHHQSKTKHALAVHLHRSHGVVSHSMQYIVDATCRWCLKDFHSTTRLRYHIEHTSMCRYGLQHVVGPIYQAGVATKRKGALGHLRVPPLQTQGPRLPTPVERRASERDAYATADDLRQEREDWEAAERQQAAQDQLGPAALEVHQRAAPDHIPPAERPCRWGAKWGCPLCPHCYRGPPRQVVCLENLSGGRHCAVPPMVWLGKGLLVAYPAGLVSVLAYLGMLRAHCLANSSLLGCCPLLADGSFGTGACPYL